MEFIKTAPVKLEFDTPSTDNTENAFYGSNTDSNNFVTDEPITKRRVASEPCKKPNNISKEPRSCLALLSSENCDQFSFVPSAPLRVQSNQNNHASPRIRQDINSIGRDLLFSRTSSRLILSPKVSKTSTKNVNSCKPNTINSGSTFPKQFNVQEYEAQNEQLDPPLTNSSSFEIETSESPQLLYSPFFEHPPMSLSPPNEPKVFTSLESSHASIRDKLIHDPTLFSANSFQEFMEDRLLRWRPSDSQHNTDVLMEGKHPFTEQNFGNNVDQSKKGYSLNVFNWFSSKNNNTTNTCDLEKQEVEPSDVFYTAEVGSSHGDIMCRYGQGRSQDLDLALRSVHANGNSSNSILPTFTAKPVLSEAIQSEQLPSATGSSVGPTYTPNAIPFSEFELDFNTRNRNEINQPDYTFDSLGNDVLELINGNDNFITSCLSFFKC